CAHALLGHGVLCDLRDTGVSAHVSLEIAINQVIVVLIGDGPEAAEPVCGRLEFADRHTLIVASAIRIVLADGIAANVTSFEAANRLCFGRQGCLATNRPDHRVVVVQRYPW